MVWHSVRHRVWNIDYKDAAAIFLRFKCCCRFYDGFWMCPVYPLPPGPVIAGFLISRLYVHNFFLTTCIERNLRSTEKISGPKNTERKYDLLNFNAV
jgi:hypothetical protein